jgi:DNA-binding transcriptional MerR regulator/effector-binding domain-containing protein
LLKIGDFARIGQVSIKALRHYDTLGLLRPAHVQPETGYRFYDLAQLSDLARILALKDCGFALDEIAQLMRTRDAAEITEMLRVRVEAQREHIATEEARLQRITARLSQLAASEGDDPQHDVMLKRSESLTLLGLRNRVLGQGEIGPFAVSVVERLTAENLWLMSPLVHLYYEVDPDSEEYDLFVGATVSGAPREGTAWTRLCLPAGELLACVIYRGDYPQIGSAFATLGRWLLASGYEVTGPCREVYHRSPAHTANPDEYVTEIQYPVTPAQPAAPQAERQTESEAR